jgi:hypothetical protein
MPVQTSTTVNVKPPQPSSGPPSACSLSVAVLDVLLAGGQAVVLLNAMWIERSASMPVQVHQYFGVTTSPM